MSVAHALAMSALMLQPPSSSADRKAAALADARELIFGTPENGPGPAQAGGPGKANVCATSDAAKRLYPGVGISAVTRSNPFMPYPEVNGGGCAIYTHAEPTMGATVGKTDYQACSVTFRTEQGRQVIDIAPRSPPGGDRFVLSECFYRLALHLEGYRGALRIAREKLFVSTNGGFWIGQVQFVGPIATMVPLRLSILCPDLERIYYRADFTERVRRCLPE